MWAIGIRTKLSVLLLCFTVTGISCTRVVNYDDPESPRYVHNTGHTPTAIPDSLIIVTHNIKLGLEVDRAIEEIDVTPQLREADIVLLQEMDHDGVERLASHFDLNYVYYPIGVHPKNDRDFGNAVLSRWPLKDPVKVILPFEDPMRKQKRIATAATVVIGSAARIQRCGITGRR